MAAALERAIAAAPADPSLRLAQLWLELRRGAWARAVEHAVTGLAHETLPYRRAQLLLWGARAAIASGDPVRARGWRVELAMLSGDGVPFLQELGRKDEPKPVSAFQRKPTMHLTLLEASYG